MSRFQSHVLILSVLVLALLATPAYSTTITTYSNVSSWQAATTGDQLINFEGQVPTEPFTTYSSYSQAGVQFFGITGSTFGIADTASSSFSPWANYGTGDAAFVCCGPLSFHVTLPTGVTAFGVNLFNSNSSSPSSYTVSVLGTPFTAPTLNLPTPAFFGVTSDTAIPTVDLTLASTGGSYAFLDNFQWGTSQVTGGGGGGEAPEASTLLMIGTGLVGLALIRKRTRAH